MKIKIWNFSGLISLVPCLIVFDVAYSLAAKENHYSCLATSTVAAHSNSPFQGGISYVKENDWRKPQSSSLALDGWLYKLLMNRLQGGLSASFCKRGCATAFALHRAVAHGQYKGFVTHINP